MDFILEIIEEDISLMCDGDARTKSEWVQDIANAYKIGGFYADIYPEQQSFL